MDRIEVVLERLSRGSATLADLRAALPEGDGDRRALPSMGERDPFGDLVADLVGSGRIRESEGRYTLR